MAPANRLRTWHRPAAPVKLVSISWAPAPSLFSRRMFMHRVVLPAVSALLVFLSAARGDGPADVLDQAPSKFAQSGGHKVHYKSLGEGKTAVVFVHGWCCDHTVWRDQAAALEGKVRMLFIDLPGYGKSDKPRIDYTMDVFAKGVDAVLRDAGVEQAVLVGH